MPAYELAHKYPTLVWKIFYPYIKLIEALSNLTENDLKIIQRAVELHPVKLKSNGSAAHNSVIDFFEKTTQDQRIVLQDFMSDTINPKSSFFRRALEDLTRMMKNGHDQKVLNPKWDPLDGDAISDGVIWGHTQLTDPKTLIEFTICHYLERFMSAVFQDLGLKMAFQKDWFLNVITDVIALKYMQGDSSIAPIARSWSVPRIEGGLGWLKQDRLDAFEQAINELAES